MPENIVKQISIGGEIRELGAEYAGEERSLKNLFAEFGAEINNKVDKDELEEEVKTSIESLVSSGELEVKAVLEKSITIQKDIQQLSLSNSEEDPAKIVKIIIFQSNFEDTDTGVVKLDNTESETPKTPSYWRAGATLELYKNVLLHKDTNGNVICQSLADTDSSWGTLELTNLTKPISVLIYKENWEEKTTGGTE